MSRGDEARAAVIQADREAAAGVVNLSNQRIDIRKGVRDDHPTVQAFAKHRLTFAASQFTGEMPGREEIARIIDPGKWHWHDRLMREADEDTIRGRADHRREAAASYVEQSLDKADAILALLTPAPSATGEAGNE